jgi:hypothetical protein
VVVDVDGNKGRMLGNTGIAGDGKEFGEHGRLREFPGQCVLASARSDQQNLHARPFRVCVWRLRAEEEKVKREWGE